MVVRYPAIPEKHEVIDFSYTYSAIGCLARARRRFWMPVRLPGHPAVSSRCGGGLEHGTRRGCFRQSSLGSRYHQISSFHKSETKKLPVPVLKGKNAAKI